MKKSTSRIVCFSIILTMLLTFTSFASDVPAQQNAGAASVSAQDEKLGKIINLYESSHLDNINDKTLLTNLISGLLKETYYDYDSIISLIDGKDFEIPQNKITLTQEQITTQTNSIFEHLVSINPDNRVMLRTLVDALIKDNSDNFEMIVDFMINQTDHYNHYLSDSDYELAYNPPEYYGIGVTVELKSGYITVEEVKNGSARKAGMQVGDQLVSVDGKDVTGMSIADVGKLIRGENGTKVTVGVMRKTSIDVITFDMQRAPVYNDSLTYEILKSQYGYIKISDFSSGYVTFFKLNNALRDLTDKKIDKCIIDLRGNPGGDVDLALNMVNLLIPKKDVLMATFHDKGYDEPIEVYSTGDGYDIKNIVVLVDETSASSSEVFAGILKDLHKATIVGETTYGKSRGQNHIQLEDGSWLIVTVSEITLPQSGYYDGIGIAPDIAVKNQLVSAPVPELLPLDITAGQTPANIKAAKQRLSILGYYDSIYYDTVLDQKLITAVQIFQKRSGLEVSGILNEATLRAMEDDTIAYLHSYVEEDTQLIYAMRYLSRYSK